MNVLGTGYVGVGKVTRPATVIDKFMVNTEDGELPFSQITKVTNPLTIMNVGCEKAEHMVSVDWTKTVPSKRKAFLATRTLSLGQKIPDGVTLSNA